MRNSYLLAILPAVALIFLVSCFGGGENLPGIAGRVTGVLYDHTSDTPLEGVTVTMSNRGRLYTTETGADGSFSLETGIVIRNEGYNIHFSRQNYQNATRAAVFQLPNLRVDLGRVDLYDSGPVEDRAIVGRILDNLSDDGLGDASVSVQVTYTPVPEGDSVTETYVAVTDSLGNFRLTGKGFMLHSTYVLTVTKQHYITRSDVTAAVSGAENIIDGESVHLILNFGDIIGRVMDDSDAALLEGVQVSASDGLGDAITAVTNSKGEFTLKSEHFYLGRTYTVSFSKTDYFSATDDVLISHPGENPISGDPLILKINGYITGVVKNAGNVAIPGASVSTVDSGGNPVNTVSAADGSFMLSSAGFRKGAGYAVYCSHDDYYGKEVSTSPMLPGENGLGIVALNGVPTGGGYRISGTVEDWWNNAIKPGAIIKVKDGQNNDLQVSADPATGNFTVEGNFNIGSPYDFYISCPGYSGENDLAGEKVGVIIEGGSAQTLDDPIRLYPLGIRARVGGVARYFSASIKQTHEKFLTDKEGFTLSARDGTNMETSSTFYIHADDKANLYSNPWNVHSNILAVNGSRMPGIIINHRNDSRMNSYTYSLPGKSHYHFYVGVAGNYTIETYGGVDTVLYLYNASGTQLASDDDGGVSYCSRITYYLTAGWHNLRVSGYNGDTYGRFEIDVKGPAQNSGTVGTWVTDDLILSFYSNEYKIIYIAGAEESGSSGSITVTKMDRRGGLARGAFFGALRAVNQFGNTISVTDGYFNVERSE